MSQENVEIVQAAFAAYMRDDLAAVLALISPDIVFSGRPDQPDARDHHGYDGLMQASAEWLEAWDRHTLEAARIWEAGDGLVFMAGRESGRGKTSGIPIEAEHVYVSTVRGGKIVRILEPLPGHLPRRRGAEVGVVPHPRRGPQGEVGAHNGH